jgi:hypothetical protein
VGVVGVVSVMSYDEMARKRDNAWALTAVSMCRPGPTSMLARVHYQGVPNPGKIMLPVMILAVRSTTHHTQPRSSCGIRRT